MRFVLFASSLALIACSSKPTPSVEVLHRTDGDLDVKVRVASVKGTSRMGKDWIATESLAMEVTRGKDLLPGAGPHCAVSDKSTFELRVDAAKKLLAYRCKPGDAWALNHVGETALHLDCQTTGGTAAEPDLAAAKTFLDRADDLAKCAVDEKLAEVSRDSAMLTLAIDVNRASKSDERTADLLLTLREALAAKDGDAHLWPQKVWDTDAMQGIKSAERQTLPPTVYPVLQKKAVARLASAKSVNEIVELASVADGRDATFKDSAAKALKVITAAPRSGLRDLAASLVIGPLIEVDPKGALALGCEALGAGMTNGTAAFAVSRSKDPAKECPAFTTALRAHPNYSKVWMQVKCDGLKRDVLDEMPARFLDDKWKRKTLRDSSMQANPHDVIDWDTGLLLAGCPRK